MQYLYYIYPSGSIQSTIYATSAPLVGGSTNFDSIYNDVFLEVTASNYQLSGSNYTTSRLYIKSSSLVLASYPADTTTIYYISFSDFESITNNPIFPNEYATTQSIIIQQNYTLNYNFAVDQNPTSSNNALNIYDLTTTSASLSLSATSNVGQIQITASSTSSIQISASGDYTKSTINLIDLDSNFEILSTASYSSNLEFYLTGSTGKNYNLLTTIEPLAYLELTYTSSESFPVTPTSSLSDWNVYLGTFAENIQLLNSSSVLIGGNLNTQRFIYITGSQLNAIKISKTTQLVSCSIINVPLQKYPILDVTSTLNYYNIQQTTLTGSTPDLSNYQYLTYVNVSNNQLSGSITSITNNIFLNIFDCSNNALIGSIPPIYNNIRLQYFDVSNNQLTGSLPTLSSSSLLQHLDVSFNNCSGDIPSLSNNTQLTYVDLYQNQLSGSIPNLSDLTLLEFFDCGRNNLTGSIPNLDNNVLLQQFSCQENNLSGSIPSLSNNTALFAFDSSDNYITGSIPYLGNTSLQVISVANNQLTGYVSGSVPSSLTVFLAQINQLSQPAVDGILEDLDNAGATGPSAFALLNGGTNSTPSATGLTYKANLQAKGWTVLTN